MWSSHEEAELARDIIELGKKGGMSWDDFKEKHPDKCSETTDKKEDASGFGW
ncbi:hypothetical protein H1164_15685 [Thermoactinomyces daqus]|uniref:Uncharacterized protein n=1 Tax=Thermoactinomyces daqus TaxID=1329516 RepID=A0A7W1XCT4_9BACL|nr:hypothetical protein [Thermoactinomyces daqus]MBA4544294.1 hypothetical protein [Thermoactinomyces daqus]